MRRCPVVTDARVALLSRLLDHAPLFPPASLSLREALAEDERAQASESAVVLGRFVCPVSRLDELPGRGRALSAVLDRPLSADARVEAVEAPYPDDEAGLALLAGLAPEAFVELPPDGRLEERLDRLAELGLAAKVRCGGAAAPSVPELARFLRGCRERGLPFKATAGLHRALRRDGEHGFLNLLAAAVFGDDEEAALAERDPGAFRLDAEAFAWRGRSAGAVELARARREGLRAIGSCSFFEPVAELAALGMLPR
jgi:hypothetical protein